MIDLYNYFRSSSSYRVRIALNLKGLAYNYLPVHLNRNGGEQFAPAFRALSPDAVVPVLVAGGDTLTQSLAIVEWLDETQPGASPRAGTPAPSAMATPRAWPTAAWCRRRSMPSASASTSPPIPPFHASWPPASNCRRSAMPIQAGRSTPSNLQQQQPKK